MKLLKLSVGILMVIFVMACNNEPEATEPVKEETTIKTTAPAEKTTAEPDKKKVGVKLNKDGVEIDYEKKD